MRTLLLMMLMSAGYLASYAQQDEMNNGRNSEARERIRAAHAAYITERIDLSSAEAEKFWPVYREFLERRQILRDSARQGRRSDQNEKELLERELSIKQQELDLEKEYTGKLQKVISAEKLLRLRQAEAEFRQLLLRQLQARRRQRR